MTSLLDDVDELLKNNHGDKGRLLHIKETISKNKILYVSDREYLTNLCKEHLDQKNPEVKKQRYVKYSEKSDDELYSENSNLLESKNADTSRNNFKTSSNSPTNNSFCGNCGNSTGLNNFCPKCGTSQERPQSELHVKPNITSKSNDKIQNKNKPKKRLISIGIVFTIIASGAFVIPANDMGHTISDLGNLCKSPLGMMGQAFGGETVVSGCALINTLTTIATILGVFGLILIVIGIVKKK